MIGAAIFGWYLFGESSDTPLPSEWTAVERMVGQGEVEKIRVINRDKAEVFLAETAADRYRTDSAKLYRRLPVEGPHLTFTIPSSRRKRLISPIISGTAYVEKARFSERSK